MAARGLLPNIWTGLKSLLLEELSRTEAKLLEGVFVFLHNGQSTCRIEKTK